ncbi:MAG: hypothetical protein R6W70_03160 [bacterium]
MITALTEISVSLLTFATIWIIIRTKNKKAGITAMAVTAVISIILELINENVFPHEGTYYSNSLLHFPGADFPVFIPILSALYAVGISFSAIKIGYFFKKHPFFISVVCFFILINTCFIIEYFFTQTGYWTYKVPGAVPLDIGFQVYIFYTALTVPSFTIISFYKIKGDRQR